MKTNEIIVVIPLHKSILTPIEIISLKQVLKILAEYPIAFVAPKQFTELENIDFDVSGLPIYRFENDYFANLESYSRLCTSAIFYEEFSDYKYMLIYQLDAFVFSDKLMYFCDKGFDYIGAPAPRVFWAEIDTQIGNGGFSLRKINSMKKIANSKHEIFRYIEEKYNSEAVKELLMNEDKFIAFSLNYLRDNGEIISMPTLDEAYTFSVEYNINGIYENLQNHIPFGTHRWHKYRFNTWWPIIKKYGYNLSNDYLQYIKSISEDESYNLRLLDKLISEKSSRVNDALEALDPNKCFSIWGLGKYYDYCIAELEAMGINIANRYDSQKSKTDTDILMPIDDILKKEKHPIIITSTKYFDSISKRLKTCGKIRGKDFFSIYDLKQYIIRLLEIEKYGEC